MYKTVWCIDSEDMEGKKTRTELTYYHFGKTPKFPNWYMEENYVYTIEMIWSFKLIVRPQIFIKCLTHYYVIK